MNVLLLFATNSGGTNQASSVVSGVLTQKGHTVTMKNPKEVDPAAIATYDLVIFASPSWDYQEKEGMPHEDFFPLMKALEGKDLTGKKFAILGLGDSSYTKFCGGVDEFEKLVTSIKGTLVVPSVRIDGYFMKMDEHNAKLTQWANTLLG